MIYALARREAAGDDDAAPGATEQAIKSMAALLGVPPNSAAALVLAKRLLRKGPAASAHAEKAPSGTRWAALVLVIVLGFVGGLLWRIDLVRAFHALHLF